MNTTPTWHGGALPQVRPPMPHTRHARTRELPVANTPLEAAMSCAITTHIERRAFADLITRVRGT